MKLISKIGQCAHNIFLNVHAISKHNMNANAKRSPVSINYVLVKVINLSNGLG